MNNPRFAYVLHGRGVDPYENLALEEYVLTHLPGDAVILYLWQNQRTVVIGRNQCAPRECDLAALERAGGHLARRLSGGGAVYHDLGNLNFTFLMRQEFYDVNRQNAILAAAVSRFGVRAEVSGRNDLTAAGRKFSGSAYCRQGMNRYHHGTLLVDADMDALSKYLTVNAEKLKSKGVSSVRARVVNLKELAPGITMTALAEALEQAFGDAYGLPPLPYPASALDEAEILRLRETYESWDWRIGRDIPFSFCAHRRFDWGDFRLELAVRQGRVAECAAYSDALAAESIAAIPDLLRGRRIDTLPDALAPLLPDAPRIAEDVKTLIREELHV